MQDNTKANEEFTKSQKALLKLIGLNVKHFRLKKGWSEEKFAKKCHISEYDLEELEAGIKIDYSDIKLLERISSVLEVKLLMLFMNPDEGKMLEVIGSRIQKLREQKNISLAQLAEKCDLTEKHMEKIENGTCYEIDTITMFRLTEALEVTLPILTEGF